MTARTQEEILARFQAADDFFGFAAEVLALSMTAETIRKARPDADLPDGWEPEPEPRTDEARSYLNFAIGKALDHRGISASRSVIKLREFAWLLGRDDVVEAMDAAEYAQYGAPQLRAFAEGMGWPFLDATGSPADRNALDLMSIGRLCDDECVSGCGQ